MSHPPGKVFRGSSEKNTMGRRKGTGDHRRKSRGKKGNSGGNSSPGPPGISRKQRIVSLRNQVNGGTYRVDPGAVAGKMVDDAVRKIQSRIRPQ